MGLAEGTAIREMIGDKDIWRAAKLLVEQYGSEAPQACQGAGTAAWR